MIIDISLMQDYSMCIVNWLPSVDEYWVFGNSIYKDYYVTHRPDDATMSFTPTERLRKEPLWLEQMPERELKQYYNGWMLLAKSLSSIAIGVGIWALSEYGFAGQNWTGIAFLNSGSLEEHKKSQ